MASTFLSATSRYGKQRVQCTMKKEATNPRCRATAQVCQALFPAIPVQELPKYRNYCWFRCERSPVDYWLLINSTVLIMWNIGQPQSLQAVIIRSPWSQQPGNEQSGLALNVYSLGICLTLSCLLYNVSTFWHWPVQQSLWLSLWTGGSSVGAHLQKWLFPQ